jgi:hypothetical protein
LAPIKYSPNCSKNSFTQPRPSTSPIKVNNHLIPLHFLWKAEAIHVQLASWSSSLQANLEAHTSWRSRINVSYNKWNHCYQTKDDQKRWCEPQLDSTSLFRSFDLADYSIV